MDTRVFHAGPEGLPERDTDALGALLREGALVVLPTETVYGIAAARDWEEALERLRRLKGRPPERPLTVHLASPEDLDHLAAPPGPVARRLARRLWPGPLTLVLPDREGAFTGFRLPDHPDTRRVIRAAGTTVVATSANRTGDPPLVDGESALSAYRSRVEAVVVSGTTRERAPSTVVRVEDGRLALLREGALAFAEVRRAACHRILFVCTGNLCRSPMAEGLLKRLLADRAGVQPGELVELGLQVLSAGTAGICDEPATRNAVQAARELGASIEAHRSRPLTPSLMEGADEIYVAARRHLELVLHYLPEAEGRTALMMPDGSDLEDPIGRSLDEYRAVARRLERALAPLAEQLATGVDRG